MTIPFFQVTAFSQSVFGGNQACVMPMEAWLSDELLLQIAQENAVAETAYLKRLDPGVYALRWFTPDLEMDLCGHATLASAHVVLNHLEPQLDRVEFDTQSGRLVVTCSEHGLDMALPNRMPASAELPLALAESLNQTPWRCIWPGISCWSTPAKRTSNNSTSTAPSSTGPTSARAV